MDSARRVTCNDTEEFFNPVLIMGAQVFCILVLSHFFQLVLKPLPGPVAQILAGFVLGPSGLSNIEEVKKFFFQNFAGDYYESMALYARISIMFLIGLEMDVPYLRRNLRPASIIACGGILMCTIFAATLTNFIYQETGAHGSIFMMGLMLIVVLANTGSVVVIRLAAHLKFATSDVGRLAICSSLIGDMYSVVILVIVSRQKNKHSLGMWVFNGFLALFIVAVVIVVNVYLANMLNRRNRNQKYLKNKEVIIILVILFVAATVLETMGFSSIIGCFLIGSMFPRRGKAARTLLSKLTYSVHNYVFPIYFGYTGLKADVTILNSWWNVSLLVIVILLSIGGKITGTLAACHYLKMPLNEGVLLAFLMNLKGHVDLVTLTAGLQNKVVVSEIFYNLMMSAVVINSLISGPLIAFLVRRESDTLGYRHIALEWQNPESELRMLACVHGPRPVSTMVGLIASSRGSETVPLTPYLMHLIELPKKKKAKLLSHGPEEDEFSDEENYGGNDALEINDAVDIFTAETGVMIHQTERVILERPGNLILFANPTEELALHLLMCGIYTGSTKNTNQYISQLGGSAKRISFWIKAVSPFVSMYEDVCDFAEDVRASIIFLPFHKHQRIDGKLESGKEGIRSTNQKVLRHAQCSAAILVDRGHTAGASSQVSGSESLQHVATLFFGGPDDREALGFSKRLGTHHHINLTIIRFLPASARDQNVGVNVAHKEENVLMAISDPETENDADNAFLMDFYNRYVTSGQVGYVEKYVENGAETAAALRDMADIYSLFIVGKGGRHSPLTTGMSDWEECPELGTVGDFLASSDFDISGSVLVIQQHRASRNDDDNEFS